MNVIFMIGRVAFALVFILSGAMKLLDIQATAAFIAAKVTLPAAIAPVMTQLQSATSMTTPELLAVTAGAVEILAALMVAANIGARVGAIALILFTGIATFYFHDFWNLTGTEQRAEMTNALKNLSLIGALLVFFVLGPWRPIVEHYDEPPVQRV